MKNRVFRVLIVMLLAAVTRETFAQTEQHIAHFMGSVFPGEAATHSFLVDPAARLSIGLGIIGVDRLKIVFTDPTGRHLDPDALPDDPSVKLSISYTGTGVRAIERTLAIASPPPGRWTVDVSMAARAEPVEYSYQLNLTAVGATYELILPSRVLARPHEPTRVEATLRVGGHPVLGAMVKGVLRWGIVIPNALSAIPLDQFPPSIERDVVFLDEGSEGDHVAGDGIYTTTVTLEPRPWGYGLFVTATDGRNFERLGGTAIAMVQRR